MKNSTKGTQCAISIEERAIRYAEATPGAVSGANGHNQTFSLTSTLVHGFCLDGEVALSILKTHYNPKCDPQWSDKELVHKIDSAIKSPPPKPRGWLLESTERNQVRPTRLPNRKVEPPKVDPLANVKKFIGDFRCTEQDIIEASPCKLPPLIHGEHFHRQGAYLISMLYDKDDLINIVSDSKQNEKGKWHPVGYGETLPRNEWLKRLLDPLPNRPGGRWFRFNPMDGKGISDVNVTAFPYAMIEFDDIPLDLQLSLLAKLRLPIMAITFSGAKSYHALIKVDAGSLDEYQKTVDDLYARMKRYGIDPNNRNASRMSRLPGVYRGDRQQRLVYLNPEPSMKGIL
jgi:hypothetical protein